MYWEWSELNLAWYLNRPNGRGDVAKMVTRKGIAILYIYGEETRINETHRFAMPDTMSETEACNNASALYRLHLTTLQVEAEIVEVRAKE